MQSIGFCILYCHALIRSNHIATEMNVINNLRCYACIFLFDKYRLEDIFNQNWNHK